MPKSTDQKLQTLDKQQIYATIVVLLTKMVAMISKTVSNISICIHAIPEVYSPKQYPF